MDEGRSNPRQNETEEERLDRELLELLNEVRVAMPGVQVLFGFLLAVPFAPRFEETTAFQRHVFFVTLLCAAMATACMVMPTALHRLRFRGRDKPTIIKVGNQAAIGGLLFLALAMTGAVLLVTDFIFGADTAVPTVVALGFVYGFLWFGYASIRRAQGKTSW